MLDGLNKIILYSISLSTDVKSNIVMRVLASRRATKTLSEKIMFLINREGWYNFKMNVLNSLPFNSQECQNQNSRKFRNFIL